MAKRFFLSFVLFAALIAQGAIHHPAFADTFVTVPHPQAVFDSTLGTAYSLCPPGSNVCTVLSTQAGTNTFSGTVNFTGALQIGGVAQTFPTSGVLVGRTDTQTLTNKTLTSPTLTTPTLSSPVINGPAAAACGATCTLTSANASRTTLLDQASGSVATLPAATATGNKYAFVISTTVSSNKDAILAASVSDFIIGISIGETSNTPKSFPSAAATNHSLQMPFAGTQPSGGFVGDNFVCQDIAVNLWQCTGTYQAGTTPTSPFSAATS